MTVSTMSTRVRFNRVQKELAKAGVSFLPKPDTCRCCLSPSDFAEKNPHFTEVTEETALLYTSHGMEKDYRFNRKGDMLVNDCFSGPEHVVSEVLLGHTRMTEAHWAKAREVFEKYGMKLEVPESENKVAHLDL